MGGRKAEQVRFGILVRKLEQRVSRNEPGG